MGNRRVHYRLAREEGICASFNGRWYWSVKLNWATSVLHILFPTVFWPRKSDARPALSTRLLTLMAKGRKLSPPHCHLSQASPTVRNPSMGCSILGDLATPVLGMRKLSSARSRQLTNSCNGTSLLPLTTDPKLRHASQKRGKQTEVRGRPRTDLADVCFDPRLILFDTWKFLHLRRCSLF